MKFFSSKEQPKYYYVFSGRPIGVQEEVELDDDETLYERPSVDLSGVDPRIAARFERIQRDFDRRRSSVASAASQPSHGHSRQTSVATNASDITQPEVSAERPQQEGKSKISRLFKRRKSSLNTEAVREE